MSENNDPNPEIRKLAREAKEETLALSAVCASLLAEIGHAAQIAAHYDDCDHPLRSIATTCYDRLRPVKAPLGPLGDSQYSEMASSAVEAVPVVNRRDPRALRSAPTADTAARAGGPC